VSHHGRESSNRRPGRGMLLQMPPECRSSYASLVSVPLLCSRPSFRHQGSGRPTSIQDFGHPPDSAASASSVYDGNLPSIKKTQEAIKTEVSAFKKGPGMHDSGGEKSDIFK